MQTILTETDPDVLRQSFDWAAWEATIRACGVSIERPYGSAHPSFPEIRYPLNYGYVNHTEGADGHEVDVFIGAATNGLVGLIATIDHRKGDREVKLLWNCTPEDIYLANGFLNFDRSLMEGVLILRRPMHELWAGQQ